MSPLDDSAIEFIDGHADVWALFHDGERFAMIVEALTDPLRSLGLTKVAGVESRGFILGGAVAATLGVGFAAIRKGDGLYPGDKVRASTTTPDYRGKTHDLRLQKSAVRPGDSVVLVDDWAESGNQALAARSMIEVCGGAYLGLSVIVDQLPPDRRDLVGPVRCLIAAPEVRQ